uniref:Uncharacterized protein n=1 Tax=Sphenodon punctatus TaxID=8508 RepID=A0A8D0GVC7_SPHPU
MASCIAPRKDFPGTDVFASRDGISIVRSDLGCFLRAPNLHSGQGLEVWPLHPACRGGDHYVGDPASSSVYILRGGTFCRAPELGAEPAPSSLPLHPSCQDGDHYSSNGSHFHVLFLARGVVLSVADLATGADAKEAPLEPASRHGLYYYTADSTHLAFLSMDGDHGLRGHLVSRAGSEETFPIHPDVAAFLPGGLALSHGAAFGAWECVKIISNELDVPLPGTHEITRKVGFAQKALPWKVPAGGSLEVGALTTALLQSQFSLPSAYGGLGLRTEQEEWEEAAEEGEPLRVILQPRQKLYWWQYCLGLGTDPLLFCRSLKVTRSPVPPANVPLPTAD